MSRTQRIHRSFVGAAALLALVGGLLVAAPMSPANAVGPSISFAPGGPFADGDTVTVSVTGFAAEAPVAISECPSGRVVRSVGDCGPSSAGASKLVSLNGAGAGSAVLTVTVGALGNTTAPDAVCNEARSCDFVAVDITDPDQVARVVIPFGLGPPGVPEVPGDGGDPSDPEPLPGSGIALSPRGPFTDGSKVAVVASGFTPFAPVAIGQCADRPNRGPGDCGRSRAGQLRIVTADPNGVARAVLRLAYGPLGNQTAPAVQCTVTRACSFLAINIADTSEQLTRPVVFTGELVKPAVALSLSKSKVRKGKAVTFTGSVSPNATGERVLLQRKGKRGWVTTKRATISATSKYRLVWTPTSRTDYTWRIKVAAKPWHPASTSKARRLKVS